MKIMTKEEKNHIEKLESMIDERDEKIKELEKKLKYYELSSYEQLYIYVLAEFSHVNHTLIDVLLMLRDGRHNNEQILNYVKEKYKQFIWVNDGDYIAYMMDHIKKYEIYDSELKEWINKYKEDHENYKKKINI